MSDAQTILAVDDMKENLDIILDILNDYDVIAVKNAKEALEVLEKDKISLILLDIVMPEINGIDLCQIIKSQSLVKDIPIIFTTSQADEDTISKAYEAGASDYVCKPLKRRDVIARVNTQLKLRKTIEDLEFLASRDTMTGIYNRRKFFDLTNLLFKESNENFFLATIDIDYFKRVNDNFGHDAGDYVIKRITEIISDLLPQNSIFARMGGEEFTVVLTQENDPEKAILFFESVREKISKENLIYNGNSINSTVSIGLVHKNKDSDEIDEIIKKSDIALYEAKRTGRNKVVYR
jgi:diguanylate cyclase (GGDEF)-like protein